MKRKIPLTEHLSVGFVRFSAFFTIGSLFLILGYIMFNGFFYQYSRDYTVLSDSVKEFDGALIIANKKIPITEIPFDIAVHFFSDEYTTWKKAASLDIDMYPFISSEIQKEAPLILSTHELGSLVEYPGDTAATVRSVISQTGGVALVKAASFYALDQDLQHRVNVVRVRPYSLGVNPSVVALKGNMRIGSIAEKSIKKIYSGDVKNWAELNGYDLPIVVVIPPDSLGLPVPSIVTSKAHVIFAKNELDYYKTLNAVEGSVGIVRANKLISVDSGTGAQNKLEKVLLSRKESGRNLTLDFILQVPKDSGKFGGISTIIVNTFAMIFLTILFSVPPGLFAAIYLVEYAKEGRLVRLIRLGTETLAGIPSIIFGLFGMLVFVQGFGWGISLLSGSLTLTLMILPTIVRTAEEALKSVPRSLQEGSIALGATKVQTIFKVLLPAAFPSIASGIILATGRALGETAALIYTMGSNYNLTGGLFDSTRTLAVHIYLIIAEGIASEKAFASATVLVFFIFIINTSARAIIKRMSRMSRP